MVDEILLDHHHVAVVGLAGLVDGRLRDGQRDRTLGGSLHRRPLRVGLLVGVEFRKQPGAGGSGRLAQDPGALLFGGHDPLGAVGLRGGDRFEAVEHAARCRHFVERELVDREARLHRREAVAGQRRRGLAIDRRLEHLVGRLPSDGVDDALGDHRYGELGEAMSILGVTDWRLLGERGRYRDSGMVGTPPNDRPEAFWRSDLLAAATDLVAVIREVRPQVLVTYDDFGGYGHPDHIQAHRVAMYALTLAAAATFRPDLGPAWDVAKVYWTAFPRSIVREGIERLRAAGETTGFADVDPDDIPFAIDDALVTTAVHAPEWLERKLDALRAHETQVTVDGGFFALADNVGAEAFSTEYFRLVRGAAAGPFDESGRETDLFAGI